jgi:hypothetical protein
LGKGKYFATTWKFPSALGHTSGQGEYFGVVKGVCGLQTIEIVLTFLIADRVATFGLSSSLLSSPRKASPDLQTNCFSTGPTLSGRQI